MYGVSLFSVTCFVGSFSHSVEQLRERPNLTKTKMCALIEAGQVCAEGDKCPYAHAISELRATPMLYRTVLCSWWKMGQCEFGDNCRFAHGEHQLRDGSPVPAISYTSGNSDSQGNLSTAAFPPEPTSIEPSVTSPSDFVASSPLYAAIFSAALAAATTAAMHNRISVLTPEQTAAVAAAAAAAASEALKLQPSAEPMQPRTSSAPVVSPATLMKNELKKFKKGFSSSPALLAFLGSSGDDSLLTGWTGEEAGSARPRADSEPGLKVTERLMEEIRKLWLIEQETEVPMGLSASHATLEAYGYHLE